MKFEDMINTIQLGDCYELIKQIPDKSIDLVYIDIPYLYTQGGGSSSDLGKRTAKKRIALMGSNDKYIESLVEDENKRSEALRIARNKAYNSKDIVNLEAGIDYSILDELCRVMKKINIYIWCSKGQLRQIIDYFDDLGCNLDLLTWHKTNPIPTCNNTYLSDTEYCIFARENGVKLNGTVETKKKYYVTPCNVLDKDKFEHPTIKPLNIIENLIINSSDEGGGSFRYLCWKWNNLCCSKEIKQEIYRNRIKSKVSQNCSR